MVIYVDFVNLVIMMFPRIGHRESENLLIYVVSIGILYSSWFLLMEATNFV